MKSLIKILPLSAALSFLICPLHVRANGDFPLLESSTATTLDLDEFTPSKGKEEFLEMQIDADLEKAGLIDKIPNPRRKCVEGVRVDNDGTPSVQICLSEREVLALLGAGRGPVGESSVEGLQRNALEEYSVFEPLSKRMVKYAKEVTELHGGTYPPETKWKIPVSRTVFGIYKHLGKCLQTDYTGNTDCNFVESAAISLAKQQKSSEKYILKISLEKSALIERMINFTDFYEEKLKAADSSDAQYKKAAEEFKKNIKKLSGRIDDILHPLNETEMLKKEKQPTKASKELPASSKAQEQENSVLMEMLTPPRLNKSGANLPYGSRLIIKTLKIKTFLPGEEIHLNLQDPANK